MKRVSLQAKAFKNIIKLQNNSLRSGTHKITKSEINKEIHVVRTKRKSKA